MPSPLHFNVRCWALDVQCSQGVYRKGAKGAEGRKVWDDANRGGGEVEERGAEEYFEKPLASATEMRHFSAMSMLTLTPTAARGNLSELLRRALKGDDIGIVVDGKIEKARKVGKLHDFTGDVEALLEGKSH